GAAPGLADVRRQGPPWLRHPLLRLDDVASAAEHGPGAPCLRPCGDAVDESVAVHRAEPVCALSPCARCDGLGRGCPPRVDRWRSAGVGFAPALPEGAAASSGGAVLLGAHS